MVNQAIDKLQAEMKANDKDSHIKAVGEYLIVFIKNNNEHAASILAEGKSIKESLVTMKNEAKKVAKNGVAMLTPDEAFKIVLKYFEVNQPVETKLAESNKPTETKPQNKAHLSFEDFL